MKVRRILVVDRGLQFHMLAKTLVCLVLIFIVMCAGLLVPMVNTFEGDGAWDQESALEGATALLYIHEHCWPVALVGLLLAIVGVGHLTHRLAGPLIRVRRHLRAIGDGYFPEPLMTRRNDFLKDDIEALNAMVASLSKRVDVLKQAEAALKDSVLQCATIAATQSDAGAGGAIREAVQRVVDKEAILADLLEALGREEDSTPNADPSPRDLTVQLTSS